MSDRLADVLAEAFVERGLSPYPSIHRAQADAIRAALRDGTLTPEDLGISGPLNAIAAVQAREVERIWPTPEGQDPLLRQLAALTEEVGEVARALLKRSHAARSADGRHKGRTVAEWSEEVALEMGQALGVLLGLAHQEGVDLDARMASTIANLVERPSILPSAAPSREDGA